jgi:hypothetical protein
MLEVIPLQIDVVKPDVAPVAIWRCRSNECKAWVREELAGAAAPGCPLCSGAMIRSIKHLPRLVKKIKPAKKPTIDTPWLQ